jgi:hypothetical protein
LPVPLSPVSSTVDAGLEATFLIRRLDDAERLAVPDDAIETIGLGLAGPQRSDLPAQPRGLERLLDQEDDLVEVERLVRKMVGAVFHRLDGGIDARVRGQQDDERIGVALLDALEHAHAVTIGQR